MKAVATWTLGTSYVLAALAGSAALIWTASYADNSAQPTSWGLGFVILFTPLAVGGGVVAWRRWAGTTRVDSRVLIVLGLGFVGALLFGVQGMVGDANACHDDDCLPLSLPVSVVSLAGIWGLPGALWVLGRVRYPAPLLTVSTTTAGFQPRRRVLGEWSRRCICRTADGGGAGLVDVAGLGRGRRRRWSA